MKRKILRGIAIALLVMPEPFTTPIGALLLGISFLLPKSHRDNLRNVETLVRRYLNTSEESGLTRLIRNSIPPMFHNLNRNLPVADNRHNYSSTVHVTPWHDDAARNIRAGFQQHYISDSRRVNDTVIHHVLNNSVPQYDVHSVLSKDFKNTPTQTVLPPPQGVYYSSLKPLDYFTPRGRIIHHNIKRV